MASLSTWRHPTCHQQSRLVTADRRPSQSQGVTNTSNVTRPTVVTMVTASICGPGIDAIVVRGLLESGAHGRQCLTSADIHSCILLVRPISMISPCGYQLLENPALYYTQ